MSRSRKKHPVTGMTGAETEKKFKQQAHQSERTAVRAALSEDKEILPHPKEYGNPWSGPKDGKQWTEDQVKAKRK